MFEDHSINCGSGSSTQNENVGMLVSREVLESTVAVESHGSEEAGSESQPTEEVKLSTLPSFTLDDRNDQLEKFEVVLLKKAQVKEFEEMFHKKEFLTVKDPLYRAWLTLKFAASGTEREAIDRLLSSKVAKNVPPKKIRGRKCSPVDQPGITQAVLHGLPS